MKVSVLEAVITQNLSLLWQIDIGFYDDMPWIRQHIVKSSYLVTFGWACANYLVWDIVTQDEVRWRILRNIY